MKEITTNSIELLSKVIDTALKLIDAGDVNLMKDIDSCVEVAGKLVDVITKSSSQGL